MFKALVIKIIPILILFLSFKNFSQAQMPDWTLIIDKDNNRYYIDKNGKIWTSGNPEFDYKPVSIEGLDYYLTQGIELIKDHNKSEGLTLLKSIMALPVKNDIVYKAQIAASKQINHLIKTEGTRYNDLNEKASVLLFKDNNSVTLIKDNMQYTIKAEAFLKIISLRARQKPDYKYCGMLLGFRFTKEAGEDKKDFSGYDLLIAIDSEKFPNNIKNLEKFIDDWRKRTGNDTLERSIIRKNSTQIIYNYRDKYTPYYSGFEGFYIKNNFGYYLKAITSSELFQKYKTEIKGVIESFKI
jgi:hypothetical protein